VLNSLYQCDTMADNDHVLLQTDQMNEAHGDTDDVMEEDV
jgi:hypothetical protein